MLMQIEFNLRHSAIYIKNGYESNKTSYSFIFSRIDTRIGKLNKNNRQVFVRLKQLQ